MVQSQMSGSSLGQLISSAKTIMSKKRAALVAKISRRGRRNLSIWTLKNARTMMTTTSTRTSTKMKMM